MFAACRYASRASRQYAAAWRNTRFVIGPLLHFAHHKALIRLRMPFAKKPIRTAGLLVTAIMATALANASEQTVTLEALRRLPDFPSEYQNMPYSAQVQWLQQALAASDSAARRYQLARELAFVHNNNYANDKALPICTSTPPLDFDLYYRYLCADANTSNYEESIRKLLALHDDAIAADNHGIAAAALSAVAWKQSSNGDIANAFRSYERALALAEKSSPESVFGIMLDTATQYVMHGDHDYVQKGIQLQRAAITRLEALKQEKPKETTYADENITLILHNVGVAYALHLYDYAQALQWFDRVNLEYTDLRRSTLVFSALAAAELGQTQLAKAKLTASLQAPKSAQTNTDYLECYQQLVRMKIGEAGELRLCQQLPAVTQLEVTVDLYKRMAKMSQPDWRLVGLEGLHELFVSKLEPQLKQSSTQAASHAELSRLQVESKLKTELLEKEQALKQAEQGKRETQSMLMVAASTILLLIILVITIQLRQNRKLAKQYESLSVRDGLTGLNNRRYFEQNIERELNFVKRSQRDGTGHSLAIFLLDIDHFKSINDNHGHDAGDEVIIEFSRRIKNAIRETDMLIRWGGEEFLLVTRLEQIGEYHHIADRIRTAVTQQPFTLSKQTTRNVTCTIGAAVYPHADGDVLEIAWNKLVQLADIALYMGKRTQRNSWICVDNVLDIRQIDTILGQDLERSIQNGQVRVSSQFAPAHQTDTSAAP